MRSKGTTKGINGRKKGCKAERAIAKLLSDWWQAAEPGCTFLRTPLSGGWATSKVRADMKASGDVTTTADRFPFTVEVKRREGWSLDWLLEGKPSAVWGWWEQAQAQGLESKLEPLLIFRGNRMGWSVLLGIPACAKLAVAGLLDLNTLHLIQPDKVDPAFLFPLARLLACPATIVADALKGPSHVSDSQAGTATR